VCVSCFFEGGLDIKPCRIERNWLQYITKEDDQTYFNCPIDKLSFYYRSTYWVKSGAGFKFSDPFVVQ